MKFGLETLKYLVGGKLAETQQKRYLCWKCGKNYVEPVDYLWHIQYC